MDSELWRRVERVLDAALARDPAEWDAVLDEECRGDVELRGEVEALLGQVGAAERFLEAPPAAAAAALLADDAPTEEPLEDRRIGAYRVVRELGRGGMSRVYLAERADGQFRQRVALKLLRPGLDSEIDVGRFRAERQILASLNHANIARLLDGGVTDEGLPYLALEYVDGRPIDAFCAERRLPLAARLELFLTVCEATEYAHRNLVVHRDLKPSNVLVTTDGTVKLLDFGLAKLLEPDEALGPTLTRTGQRWMTPGYAAPEQILGDPITTLTDVYQLGAVLYELLSGERPFGAKESTLHALEEAVLKDEPSPPSAAALRAARAGTGDPERAAALRGDLDAIVLKALRKEPERRYATVAALEEDVRRFLAGRPVRARSGGRAYRLRKFVGRNRVAVSAAALVVLALIAATAVTASQMVEARRQRDVARVERDRARFEERRALAASGFMETLLQSVAPTGRAYTTLELLGRARELLERDFRGDPRFVARMMIDLSENYATIDEVGRQLTLLGRASELAAASADDEAVALAECSIALIRAGREQPDSARGHLVRGTASMARVRDPATRARMGCLLARAQMAIAGGADDSALALAHQAVALAAAAGDTASVEYADALATVAVQLQNQNRVRDALVANRRAVATLNGIGRGSTLPALLATFEQARYLRDLGEMRSADSVLRAVLQLEQRVDSKEVAAYASILAGEIAHALDRPDSAAAAFEHALADARRTRDRFREQWALERLVALLADYRRTGAGRERMAELTAITPARDRPTLQMLEARFAETGGAPAVAYRTYMDALKERGFPYDRDIPPWHRIVYHAARSALESGDAIAADSLARHALRLERELGHDERRSGDMGLALLLEARARMALGDPASARQLLRQAVAPLEAGLGPEHAGTREARQLLASSTPLPAGPSPSTPR